MKTLALFILVAVGMPSCTSGPIIRETGTRDAATGAIVGSTTIFMGGTLAAKRKGVVTQAKKTGKGGWNISYMVDSESSESVPMAGMAAWASAAMSSDAASVSTAKEATTRHTATQATIQHGKTVDGQVALGTEAIKGGTPVTIAPLKTP
jgi:hypothetical protein